MDFLFSLVNGSHITTDFPDNYLKLQTWLINIVIHNDACTQKIPTIMGMCMALAGRPNVSDHTTLPHGEGMKDILAATKAYVTTSAYAKACHGTGRSPNCTQTPKYSKSSVTPEKKNYYLYPSGRNISHFLTKTKCTS